VVGGGRCTMSPPPPLNNEEENMQHGKLTPTNKYFVGIPGSRII
jgi:hypothetical protein